MHVYSSQLLLPYHHPGAPQWEKNDSQDLYQKNLLTQPDSWHYRHHSVSYTWNTNGYRCAEWDSVDWSLSHVIMGCSYAQGLGIDDSDTISAGVPNGVNLAQSGSNAYVIQYNSLRLIDAGIRPRSVKIIIPDLTRSVYWGTQDWVDLTAHDLKLRGHGLNTSVRDYYQGWLAHSPNAEQATYMTVRSTQALWQAVGVDCELYHHWMPYDSKFIIAPQLPQPVDLARDCVHPGPITHSLWRDFIYT